MRGTTPASRKKLQPGRSAAGTARPPVARAVSPRLERLAMPVAKAFAYPPGSRKPQRSDWTSPRRSSAGSPARLPPDTRMDKLLRQRLAKRRARASSPRRSVPAAAADAPSQRPAPVRAAIATPNQPARSSARRRPAQVSHAHQMPYFSQHPSSPKVPVAATSAGGEAMFFASPSVEPTAQPSTPRSRSMSQLLRSAWSSSKPAAAPSRAALKHAGPGGGSAREWPSNGLAVPGAPPALPQSTAGSVIDAYNANGTGSRPPASRHHNLATSRAAPRARPASPPSPASGSAATESDSVLAFLSGALVLAPRQRATSIAEATERALAAAQLSPRHRVSAVRPAAATECVLSPAPAPTRAGQRHPGHREEEAAIAGPHLAGAAGADTAIAEAEDPSTQQTTASVRHQAGREGKGHRNSQKGGVQPKARTGGSTSSGGSPTRGSRVRSSSGHGPAAAAAAAAAFPWEQGLSRVRPSLRHLIPGDGALGAPSPSERAGMVASAGLRVITGTAPISPGHNAPGSPPGTPKSVHFADESGQASLEGASPEASEADFGGHSSPSGQTQPARQRGGTPQSHGLGPRLAESESTGRAVGAIPTACVESDAAPPSRGRQASGGGGGGGRSGRSGGPGRRNTGPTGPPPPLSGEDIAAAVRRALEQGRSKSAGRAGIHRQAAGAARAGAALGWMATALESAGARRAASSQRARAPVRGRAMHPPRRDHAPGEGALPGRTAAAAHVASFHDERRIAGVSRTSPLLHSPVMTLEQLAALGSDGEDSDDLASTDGAQQQAPASQLSSSRRSQHPSELTEALLRGESLSGAAGEDTWLGAAGWQRSQSRDDLESELTGAAEAAMRALSASARSGSRGLREAAGASQSEASSRWGDLTQVAQSQGGQGMWHLPARGPGRSWDRSIGSASPDGRAASSDRPGHAGRLAAGVAAARHALGNPDVDSSGFALPAHPSAPSSTPDSGSVSGSSSHSETGSSSSSGAPGSRSSSNARRVARAVSPRGSPMSEAGRRRALDLLRAANAAAVATLRPPSPQRQRAPPELVGLDEAAPPPPPPPLPTAQLSASSARGGRSPQRVLHSRHPIGASSAPGSLSDDSLGDDDGNGSEQPPSARPAVPSAQLRLVEAAADQALVSWN